MSFWLSFGITEEFESGSGASAGVIDPSWESFEAAANSLTEADDPIVGGGVTEAHAYVVEADSRHEAAALMKAVWMDQEPSLRVRLVQRDTPTQRKPPRSPDDEASHRVFVELCIAHQIAEFALARALTDEQRTVLKQHTVALEDSGFIDRLMGDGRPPSGTRGSTGGERMGYRDAHPGAPNRRPSLEQ
ncbi:MAG: hypothetical protein ACR2GA_06455 [Chloroflexota bacterium]